MGMWGMPPGAGRPDPEPEPGPCTKTCCVPRPVNWLQCVYLVCDSVVTTRFRAEALLGEEVRVCPTHERRLRQAERDGFQIRYSREGWLWVDDLLRFFFAT